MIHSKFKDIVFPFFAKKHNPYSVKYKKDVILVKINSHSKDAILDQATEKTKNFSYLDRVASLDDRIAFDYTCRNLTELINANPTWGVDSTGKVFDLVNRETYPAKLSKIRKILKDVFWVYNVSYPFKLDKSINLVTADLDVLKTILLYIDREWVLYQFTYENEINEYISL